jgi:hypothetical protein
MNYKREAKIRWGKKAKWIEGDGQYALLIHCGVFTVSLHKTMESAEKDKKFIETLTRAGSCIGHHGIVDLKNLNEQPE